MRYSFVIPTYNNAKLLLNNLEALNHLVLPEDCEFETIVVDDGSDTDTYSVISQLPVSYRLDYIYLERCEESSRARARNRGIDKATGDIVVFIDSDIIVNPDYITELERCFRYNKDCIVVGTRILLEKDVSFEEVKDGSIFKESVRKKKGARKEFRKEIFEDLSYNASSIRYPCLYCYSCNLAIPREKIVKCNGFDEELKKWGVEDVELVYRIIQDNTKIIFNSRNQVMHQFHGVVMGKYVKDDQINEVDYNANVFIRKHKGAFGLNDDGIRQLFRSIATRYGLLEHTDNAKKDRNIVEFVHPESLEKIKKFVSNMLKIDNLDIVVIDYNEKTDIDMWIQNLECKKGRLKYYPVSCVDLNNVLAAR